MCKLQAELVRVALRSDDACLVVTGQSDAILSSSLRTAHTCSSSSIKRQCTAMLSVRYASAWPLALQLAARQWQRDKAMPLVGYSLEHAVRCLCGL